MKRVRKKHDFSWAIPDRFLPNKISFVPKTSRLSQTKSRLSQSGPIWRKQTLVFQKHDFVAEEKTLFVTEAALFIRNEVVPAEIKVLSRKRSFVSAARGLFEIDEILFFKKRSCLSQTPFCLS